MKYINGFVREQNCMKYFDGFVCARNCMKYIYGFVCARNCLKYIFTQCNRSIRVCVLFAVKPRVFAEKPLLVFIIMTLHKEHTEIEIHIEFECISF